jgi:large subunit ribosomal protein L25
VQYDHLGMHIIHADFARVDLNEKVTVTVGIELKGDAPGEKAGGIVQQTLSEIEVECVVTEIPDGIVYNVSNLQLDDSIHVRDLPLPSGVTAITDGEQIVAVCHAIKEAIVEEEVVPEPEVIKRGPGEGEGFTPK